ncbi:MAG: GIY-YIG nuclease family protein [Halobacteriota archaeon]
MTTAAPGSYVLVLSVEVPVTIDVGALGPIDFEAGGYAYVGRAFGPGGLGRVDRHRELARGDRETRHWHVDYLLGDRATRLIDVVTYPNRDVECALADDLPGQPIDDFGSSDCDCGSHLLFCADPDRLRAAAQTY